MTDLYVDYDTFPDAKPMTRNLLSQLTSVDMAQIHDIGEREGMHCFLFLGLAPDEISNVNRLMEDESKRFFVR